MRPINAICHSVNVTQVVVLPAGGGDLNITCCNQSCFKFLLSRVVGIQKPSLDCPHTPFTLAALCTCILYPCVLVLLTHVCTFVPYYNTLGPFGLLQTLICI